MQTKKLGNTDITVSAIGLGGMPMSLSGRPPESQSIEVIHRTLDLGITLIDTADSYCQDESDKHHNEKLIAKALAEYSGDTSSVIVATKGGLMRPQGSWTRNGSPHHCARQFAKVLKLWAAKTDRSLAISLARYRLFDRRIPRTCKRSGRSRHNSICRRFQLFRRTDKTRPRYSRNCLGAKSVQSVVQTARIRRGFRILRKRKTDIFSLESVGGKPPRQPLARNASVGKFSPRKKRFSLLYSISLVDGKIALRAADSRR